MPALKAGIDKKNACNIHKKEPFKRALFTSRLKTD